MKYTMSNIDVMKMLYAIYSGKEGDLPVINIHCTENLSCFEKLSFIGKDSNGKAVVEIPVILMEDRWTLYDISNKYSKIIKEQFYDEIKTLMKKPVKLPPHLKSVPDWQRYLYNCAQFPMLVILRAKCHGLFLKDYNLDNYPVPAIFLAIEN